MTDGWSDETAYGWHLAVVAPQTLDEGDAPRGTSAAVHAAYAAQPAPPRRMVRFWARNSGQFYVRSTTATVRMMRTLAQRMDVEQVWDQSAYSQEGLWPAYGGSKPPRHGGRTGSRVSVRSLVCATPHLVRDAMPLVNTCTHVHA